MCHRELGDQRQLLEDDRDAPLPGSVGRADVHDLAVDPDLALLGSNDSGHDLHERALAGSVLTEERVYLGLFDREFRVLEGVDPAVLLGDTMRRKRFVF